ncbi:hypothetical protein COOONC_18963 [Cooperia oncophora]
MTCERERILSTFMLRKNSVPDNQSGEKLHLEEVSTMNLVLLIVHACEGYVRMSVYRNGKLLKRSEPFSGFRRFLVVNIHSGQLRFQISNDDAKPKTVHLWARPRPINRHIRNCPRTQARLPEK